MRVLVACEMSGRVTNEFRKLGHEAYSCDILPTEGNPDWHIQDDVLPHLNDGWDLMIAFPPCTDLAVSGATWFEQKRKDGRQQKAIEFFMRFADTDIPKTAIENPVGVMSTTYRKPDQIIQPWQFGHKMSKKTCLWLSGLPPLVPTAIVAPDYTICKSKKRGTSKYSGTALLGPSPMRSIERSRTFEGIACAMAEQWGGDIRKENENV